MSVINPDRSYWLKTMLKIADPVLHALEKRQLKQVMPVETVGSKDRTTYTYLEALARLLNGMAPWLERKHEKKEEEQLRQRYAQLAREAIKAGTDPNSPDYMHFANGGQPLVDTAFLAHAMLRAPHELWEKQDKQTKYNVIQALQQTRAQKPAFNNWLLFSAMIEVFFYKTGESDWDLVRIDYALKQLEQWYIGDGLYRDGSLFHFDYYNSFVIHPMLVDILAAVGHEYPDWQERYEDVLKRGRRYAEILERQISPEGTYPPVGRSLAYRFGAFQALSQSALRKDLPLNLTPAQVRSGLTAVIKRTLAIPGMFQEESWLQIGLSGHQPNIGEGYITTGSLYLCTAIFLPLGLSTEEAFWQDPPEEWTAKRAWAGKDFPIDAALHDH
ncbi:DUF2264 domain-containing protein [Gracilibacillus timonensis]|uniref:DUF2264 domain-containing protein n=1 Tax=Gracilibacillus timonensis TaxID=1816696 RepID=UPI0008245580|nr:DUF2264 domain-containing protein [Gracilibacillus timonensis]